MKWKKIFPGLLLLIIANCLFHYNLYAFKNSSEILWTNAETRWFKAHPKIIIQAVPAWDPISMRDRSGRLSGIAGDYMRRIQELLPVDLVLAKEQIWGNALDQGKNKTVDILLPLAASSDREKYLLFTEPLFEIPYVIIVKTSNNEISSIEHLKNKVVSVHKNFIAHEWLAEKYPEIILLPKVETHEALSTVSMGEASAFVGSLADANHTIADTGLTRLKIAGESPFVQNMRIGVRNDWPELVSILNKVIKHIPEKSRASIWGRWVYLESPGISPKYFWLFGIFSLILIIIILFSTNFRLKKAYHEVDVRVHERTRELKKLTEDLKGSETRYHEIFEHAADYILVLEPQNEGPPKILEASKNAFRFHGYLPEEMIGKPITFLDPENEKVALRMNEILEKGSAEFEVVHKRKDGSTFIAEVIAKMIHVGDKDLLYTIERDITDKKVIQNALKLSREKFLKAFFSSPDAIVISKLQDGIIVEVNTGFCDLSGYRVDEVLNRSIGQLKLWSNKKDMENIINILATGGFVKDIEFPFRTKSGKHVYCLYSADTITLEGERYVISVVRDISERKKSEDVLNLFFKLSLDLLCIVSSDGYFQKLNPAFEKLLGYSASEMMSKEYTEFIHPDDVDNTVFEIDKLLKGGPSKSFENRYICKNGSYKWLAWTAAAHNEEGLVYAAARDITEQKEQHEVLKYQAAHDPLTGLINRRMLEEKLTDEVLRASRYNHNFSLFMIDLDFFKNLNDSVGHAAGDRALQVVSERLKGSIRTTDYAGRYGGEEFVVVMPETDQMKARELAERIRVHIEEKPVLTVAGEDKYITVSIGISTFPYNGRYWQEVLEAADIALYQAKKEGRNRVCTASIG